MKVRDILSNRPMIKVDEDIKIFMKHDFKNDILLIEGMTL